MSHSDFSRAYVEMRKAQLDKNSESKHIETSNTSSTSIYTAPNGKAYGPIIIGETKCDEYGIYGVMV